MFSVHSLHNGIDVWCSDVLWFELHAMVKLLVGLRCFESLSGSLLVFQGLEEPRAELQKALQAKSWAPSS